MKTETVLRRLRSERGLSYRAMSQEVGIHFTRVFRHENRREPLYPKDVQRYADFFGVKPEEISDLNGFASIAE